MSDASAATGTTPTPSTPKKSREYRKTKFYAAKRALQRGGLSALDGRSTLARAVATWRSNVTSDMGGEADMSQAERTLLDVAASDMVLLAIADAWIRENSAKVLNRRRKTFVPLVRERLAVASHLADTLKTLGLKRRKREIGLSAYLATKGGGA